MAFETPEESIEDGHPIELYTIELLPIFWYLTNSDRDSFSYNGNLYVPAVVTRDQPKVDIDQPGSALELIVVTNDPAVSGLTSLWQASAPEITRTKVSLHKVHIGEGTVQPFWFGSISSVDYIDDGTETSILCRSLSDLFTLEGPRKTWGTACNHQLYDGECTLSRPANTVTADVVSISADGLTYTLTSLPAPLVRYNAGEMKKLDTADSRLIVAADDGANTVTVQYIVPGIQVGDTVEVSEGCERNLTDCSAYNNDINFGGSPYTPPVNPFTKGLDAI